MDNKKRLTSFVLVSITGIIIIAGMFVYSNAKITTFEECEKAGWLVRSIKIYDSVGGYGSVEKECILWSGKSFVKKQDSFSFGNDQVEKAITDYLLTQKYFSWETTTDSRNFCVIENLNPTENGLFPLYVWVRCGEFIMQNGKLKELSGLSVPTKIDYPNQLSFYDISKFSYEVPRDGSLYSKDIKTIFPLDVQDRIADFDSKNINKNIEAVALNGLKK